MAITRGPCPGLNTLANHGYLPRDGKGITLQILKDSMLDGFNIENSDAVLLLLTQAIRTNVLPGEAMTSHRPASTGFHVTPVDLQVHTSISPVLFSIWYKSAGLIKTPLLSHQSWLLRVISISLVNGQKEPEPLHNRLICLVLFSSG